jgi:hypothetical protein
MSCAAIERFIAECRERPWLPDDAIDAIEHWLQTALADPDPVPWRELRPVIDDEDRPLGERFAAIARITDAILAARRCSGSIH